jgi:surface antigen
MRTKNLIILVTSLSFAGLAGCTQADLSSMNSYRLSKAVVDLLTKGEIQPEGAVQYDERNTRKLADYSVDENAEVDPLVGLGRAAARKAKVTWQLEEGDYKALGENMISALETSRDSEVVTWGDGMTGTRGKIVPKISYDRLPVQCRTLDVIVDAKGSRFGTSIDACKKSEEWRLVGIQHGSER